MVNLRQQIITLRKQKKKALDFLTPSFFPVLLIIEVSNFEESERPSRCRKRMS